jgi:hypothetical protein
MKTNRWQVMASVALVFLSGIRLAAQAPGGGNIDPAQLQQRIAQAQQRMAQMDPAQLQQMVGQFLPGIGQMDPAQFQQMAAQWQQGVAQFQQRVGQVDPAQLQQRIAQLQQRVGQVDPTQLQQQRTADLREQFQITDDVDWSVIEALIQKVVDAQRVVQGDALGGMMGLGNQNGGLQLRAGLARQSPEADAVRKAVQDTAPNEEIQAALTKLQEARKAHLAALEKAQADLRKVLTLRQEAIATVNGLL